MTIDLTYKILIPGEKRESMRFSLDEKDSDTTYNQLVLTTLIGTLVKYGNSGEIEPYLAQSWTYTPDHTEWRFHIRTDVFAENGQLLNSKQVRRGLLESLFRNLKNAGKSEFEKLIGWSGFIASDACPTELAGLVARVHQR